MARGFGARQRTMLKTMEAAMRYEWHHGALAPPLCRSQIDHLFVRPFQSRISPQLFGNEAPTGAISDNPFLSERGRSVFLSAFLPEGQESTRASSPALSGPCSRRRQHAQPGALRGVRGPLDRVFPNRCGYPHRGQAHRRSEIGTILPLAPLSPVSRGKIEETDSGKTDYRHRARTGCVKR